MDINKLIFKIVFGIVALILVVIGAVMAFRKWGPKKKA